MTIQKDFDRYVFESIVEKVIVGEIDEDGKVDPYKLTFVYKTGFKDDLNGEEFKTPRKNASSKNKRIGKDSSDLSSYTNNHLDKSCSHTSDAARRVRSIAVKSTELNTEKGLKIKDFRELEVFFRLSDFFILQGCCFGENEG